MRGLKSSSSPLKHKHRRVSEAAGEELSMSGRNSEFVAAFGEVEEEQRLAEQYRSSFYYKHTKLIRVLMVLAGLKLVAKPTDVSQQHGDDEEPRLKCVALRNVLRPIPVWPKYRPKIRKPGRNVWLGGRMVWPPKMSLLTTVYLHYAFAKLLPLSILSLQRHSVLSHLKFSVQPQAPKTNSCALDEDLYFSTPDELAKFKQLKSLDAWLKFLGTSMMSLPEYGVSSMFILAIIPLFYHRLCQLFLSLNQHRSDTLCFIFDPLGERRRIGAELRHIVREMILFQSNHKDNLYYGIENSGSLHNYSKPNELGSVRSNRRPQASAISSGSSDGPELAASRRRSLLDGQTRRLRYLQTLLKIKQLEQVDPYIVTSEWHRTLLSQTHFHLKIGICFAIALGATIVLFAMIYDLCNATRLRLEMVECKKWRSQGGTRTAGLDHLYLDELKSEEQLDAYRTHDGSTLSFLKLALLVESTSYFSLRRAICWGEFLLASWLLGFNCILSTALHLLSTAEKIVWLHQIDQQVKRAADQAAEHAHLAGRFGSSAQETDERLLNTLTLAYLNYELFRRQHYDCLMITDPITFRIVVLAIMHCLIIYPSGLILGYSSSVLIFFFCHPQLITINLFLVASSYRLKQIEKIMVNASKILAHCSTGPVQLSYPVELWRRQVRAFGEFHRHYASHLFGVHITYETVISMNGYAIAVILILLRPELSSFD